MRTETALYSNCTNNIDDRHYAQCNCHQTTDYMISGLVKKRGEVAGEIGQLRDRINQVVKELDHIDGTLRIVVPDMPVESIRPKMLKPPADWTKRGQMSRIVMKILRQAKEPLTWREIAAKLILERGMAMDYSLLRLMTKRVGVFSGIRGLQYQPRAAGIICFG